MTLDELVQPSERVALWHIDTEGAEVPWHIGGSVDRWIGGSVDRWIDASTDRRID